MSLLELTCSNYSHSFRTGVSSFKIRANGKKYSYYLSTSSLIAYPESCTDSESFASVSGISLSTTSFDIDSDY